MNHFEINNSCKDELECKCLRTGRTSLIILALFSVNRTSSNPSDAHC